MKTADLELYVDTLLTGVETGNMEALLEKIQAVTASEHPSDHEYVENPDLPGTCLHCGWIEADTQSSCECGKNLRQHVEVLPDMLSKMAAEAMFMDMLTSALGGPAGMQVIEIGLPSRQPRSTRRRRTDD